MHQCPFKHRRAHTRCSLFLNMSDHAGGSARQCLPPVHIHRQELKNRFLDSKTPRNEWIKCAQTGALGTLQDSTGKKITEAFYVSRISSYEHDWHPSPQPWICSVAYLKQMGAHTCRKVIGSGQSTGKICLIF